MIIIIFIIIIIVIIITIIIIITISIIIIISIIVFAFSQADPRVVARGLLKTAFADPRRLDTEELHVAIDRPAD